MDKITASEIKKTNRNNIYNTIYKLRHTSKQQLADQLKLSLPTITHNLKELEDLNLIKKDGFYSSTASGGRKAQVISCNRRARISVGVEVLKESVLIVASDLYGTLLGQDKLKLPFECSELYYCAVGNWINSFISEHSIPRESVLGVNIAIQGLVSADHRRVVYGDILNCTGLTVEEFSSFIKYPCMFSHDTEAAAFTEIWRRKYTDFLYIMVNMTLGGALVIDGKLHNGAGQVSGTLEHTCLYPGGKPCYCGRQGCVEAYCSMGALLKDAHIATLNDFFSEIEEGNTEFVQIWHSFLRNLAMAINNSIHIIDCDVVLSGLISLFLTDDDIELLQQYISEVNSFSFHKPRICLGLTAENVAAIGAAYHLILDFLDHDEIFQ